VVQLDTLADNIRSNLLLTSDLKGYVENPGYYFLRQDDRTLHYIDNLMMTHGWRRHHIANLSKPIPMNLTHYMEEGQTISGRIRGFFGNNVKEGPIIIMAPKIHLIETTTTNSRGEFLISTLFPDSTTFLVQARTKRGWAGVDILLDKPPFAPPAHKGFFPPDTLTPQLDNYFAATRDQYYIEGGERVYNLREVVVTARRNPSRSESIYTGGINTVSRSGDELDSQGAHTALDAALRFPGVTRERGNELHIRNASQPALIIIDDVIYEESDLLSDLLTTNIESISLLRGADAAILGTRGAGGAIVVTLKEGKNLPPSAPRGIVVYTPLGYADDVEFYSPTYDTPEARTAVAFDKRSTIYWNPALHLNADGQQAVVTYYTPDGNVPQAIIIEGIDKNGKACRVSLTIPGGDDASDRM
jgi:hypothetical protein